MNRPPPMTPPDCDLRSLPAMLLDVNRLRDSELAQVDGEAFRCAVLSWCVAWHQVPAASLPDDDRQLAYLLGYGRDVRAFLRAKDAGGLRGWTLCSDGRWYHPVVAEKALDAADARRKQLSRTEAARRARHAATPAAAENSAQVVENTQPAASVTETKISEGKVREESFLRNGGAAAPVIEVQVQAAAAAGPEPEAPPVRRCERAETQSVCGWASVPIHLHAPGTDPRDARTILFTDSLRLIRHMTGQHVDKCRSILGRLLRDTDDDAGLVVQIVADAAEHRPAEPVAWIMGAAKARRPGRATAARLDRDWGLPSLASAEMLEAVEDVGL